MAGQGEAPTYTSRVGAPDPGSMMIAPRELPNVQGVGAAVEDGLTKLDAQADKISLQIKEAQEHTLVARSTTEYLTGLDALESKYQQDQDYQGAPKRFAEEERKLKEKALGIPVNEQRKSELETRLTRLQLSSAGTVRKAALGREADANVAELDKQEVGFLNRAAAAGSDTERAEILGEWGRSVVQAGAAGWISQKQVEQRRQRTAEYIDNADVMGAIRNDPSKAAALLSDPKSFPSLDPVKRQQYITAAVHGADERAIGDLQNKARFKPEIASMELGRVIAPAHADAIFINGVMPTESNNDPSVVSEKGALGISQILPGTAREVATRLGLKDVAALDDKSLEKRLLDDVPLNQRLGLTYFREQVKRYEGNIPLALAAYNAGPGRADEWAKVATEKFGPGFSAAQFASIVPFTETRDYIGKVYNRMGANPGGTGISAASIPRAATAVGGEIASQEVQSRQVAHNLAALSREDPIAKLYEHGYQVDPARESAYRLTQEQSAARGDSAAAKTLRDLDEAKAMAPFVRKAYAMSPAALDAGVAQLEVAAAQNPNLSGEAFRQLTAFRAVRDEVKQKRDHDPLALAERAGLVRPVAIDPNAVPEDPQFRATLAERGRQAGVASRQYLTNSAALKPEEAKALKERWSNIGPDEQFRMILAFGASLSGDAYTDTLKQVTGNNGLANFAGRVAVDRPKLAREILEGAAMIASKDVPDRVKEMRPALAAKLGGQIYPSPQMQDDVVNAAMALYTARRGKSGALYDANDEGGLESAIEEVAGPIVKRNGKRFPLPPTIGRRGADLIDGMTEGELSLAGGAVDRFGQPLPASTIVNYATWTPLGVGATRYVVDIAGKPVMNADGSSLVLDLSTFGRDRPAPNLTPAQRGRREYKSELFRETDRVRREAEGGTP